VGALDRAEFDWGRAAELARGQTDAAWIGIDLQINRARIDRHRFRRRQAAFVGRGQTDFDMRGIVVVGRKQASFVGRREDLKRMGMTGGGAVIEAGLPVKV